MNTPPNPTPPTERDQLHACILVLRHKGVKPWSELPGGGAVLLFAELEAWNATKGALRAQTEGLIDQTRGPLSKVLNDAAERITGSGEKKTRYAKYVAWGVPNWEGLAGRTAEELAPPVVQRWGYDVGLGRRALLLGTQDEVRARLIRDLHALPDAADRSDPWAPRRAESWGAVITVCGSVASFVVRIFASGIADGIDRSCAALVDVITKSADGVSLPELEGAVHEVAGSVATLAEGPLKAGAELVGKASETIQRSS